MAETRKITTDKTVIKKLAEVLDIEEIEVRHVKDYDADGRPSFAQGAVVTPSHYVAQNAKGQECHVPVELVDPKATPAIPPGKADATTPAAPAQPEPAATPATPAAK